MNRISRSDNAPEAKPAKAAEMGQRVIQELLAGRTRLFRAAQPAVLPRALNSDESHL